MSYPLISEYIEAIKAAEDNFDQLKHLRPVLGEDSGFPVLLMDWVEGQPKAKFNS